MNTETKLAFLKRHKKCAIREQDKLIKEFNTEIAELESQLAEAEKPKLYNGDVYAKGVYVVVVRYRKGEWETTHKDGSRLIGDAERISDHLRDFTFSHNIFADLEARQEPLKHFRVCGLDVGLNELGNIQLTNDDKDTLYIHSDDWHTFILNLQRLVYTAEASK